MADHFDQMDNQTFYQLTASVCSELGCGRVVSAQTSIEPEERPVWWIEPMCRWSTSVLRHCVALNDINYDISLKVTCSGNDEHMFVFFIFKLQICTDFENLS